MAKTPRPLHVLFGESAAGSLIQVLRQQRRADPVICLVDNLALGPINGAGARRRAIWMDEVIGYPEDPTSTAQIRAFWDRATTTESIVVWFGRLCAHEYAGLHELAWRRFGGHFKVIDITDVVVEGNGVCQSVGSTSQRHLLGQLDRARALSPVEIDRYRATWRRLRAEDAVLRIVDESGLVSASMTYFDELLVDCVTDEWQRCARVIGTSLARTCEPFHQTNDMFLWARLCALVDAGTIEGRGDFATMRTSSVRLVQR